MSDLEKLLSGVTAWDKPYTKRYLRDGTWVPMIEIATHLEAIEQRVCRLLPLLEAGQAMRASLESLWRSEFETRRDKHPELRDESVLAWDAALEKAMGK